MSKPTRSPALQALQAYHVLDTPPEKEFDDLTRLATQICGVPFGMISFQDGDRLFHKSHHGIEISESPLENSFWAESIKNPGDILVVEDARKNQRFKKHPLVAAKPKIRFFAGVALMNPDGLPLGTLSVLNTEAGKLNEAEFESLKALANQVVQLLELRKARIQVSDSARSPEKESARLETIIDATRVGTWEWNVQTGELRINERWAEIIGYRKEELEPINIKMWYKVVHPDDQERTDREMQACFEKKVTFYDTECRMRHKDGHDVWINDRGRVVSWTEDGKPLWMMGTHTDITEKKTTENQLQTISDNIPGAVFRFRLSRNGGDRLELVSNGAIELWGYSPEEVMQDNRVVWEKFDQDDLKAVRSRIRESAKNLVHWQAEWRYHHPDGTLRWHKGSGNPLRADDGSTIWNAIILDITERKQAEEERDATLDALGERVKERTVLYDIAHLSNQKYTIEQLLKKAVEMIPAGWQFPDMAVGSIAYGKTIFKTPNFKKTKWKQSVQRFSSSGEKLEITIAYLKKTPAEDEDPFLAEEWELLNNIADNLIVNINHIAVNEYNELILQTTDEGIYGIDEKGQCTFINQSAAKMLGFATDECLGKNMHQLIHHHKESGENYRETECPIYKSRKNIDGCRVESEVFWTKNNTAFPVRYSSSPILVNGQYRGAVVVFNDISESKKARQELQIRERRFRALVENGADAIAILGADGNTKYASPSTFNILGYTDEEAMSLNLFSIIHPEDQPEVAAKMQEAIQNPGVPVKSIPSRAQHKNGTWRWVEATVTNLLHDPAINGIVDNFQDVTERVQFENYLKASEEKYRSLFDISPLPMWIYDLTTGAILDVNQTAIEKYGYSRKEFLDLHITDLRPKSEMPTLKEAIKSVKNLKGTKRFGVFTHLTKSGEIMRMDASGHRLQFDNNDSLLVVCNDVTEQEVAFDALQASEARIRGLYDSQTTFILRTDMEGRYTYVNTKFEKEFGWIYPGGKILGKNSMTSILERDHQKVAQVVAECVNEPGKACKAEIDKPAPEGGFVTTLWDFVCIADENGMPSEIQCVGFDITERIKTERALAESHERYELVNRATNDAIYDWDVKKDRFIWGDGFYRIFNYTDEFEAFRLEDWTRLTHPADSAAHQQEWDAFMADENQQKWVNEFRFKRADGSFAYVEEIGYMIRDENGHPERMIGVLRDQTQVKLAEILQDLIREIALHFKISTGLSETLNKVARYLTRTAKFKTAEIWLTSSDKKHLHLVSNFAVNKTSRIFISESADLTRIERGKGLLSTVWKKNEVIIWNDVQSKKAFVRKNAATKAGLHTMVGIPLTHNQEVIGVLMMGDGKFNAEQETNAELVSAIGPFLGAEIKRKQQEEELHLFFENAPEILAVAAPNGYFSKVNPAFCKTLGYTAKELTSKPIFDFIHPEDVGKTTEEYEQNKTGVQQADNHINRYRTKNGEFKWFSWKSSEPFGEEGQFFAYGRDITEQKIAEEKLHNKTRQLNAIASINSQLINYENWHQVIDESFAQIAEVVKADRVYYFKNGVDDTTGQNVTSQILEWSRQNIEPQISNPEMQNVPVEIAEEFFEPLRRNKPYQKQVSGVKNNVLREMLSSQDIKSVLCLPIVVNSSFWGFIGFDDCTRERQWAADEIVFLRTIAANLGTAIESQEADQQLKEAHDERSNILESIGDAFFAIDKNWIVTYWNKIAEKVLGMKKEEVVGQEFWELFEDAKNLKFYEEYHRAAKTGQIVDFEEFYPTTNSWYEVSVYPSDKGLSVYFRDVSIRKNAEEQIRQSSERFEKVTEATNDAIWDFDVANNELFWGKGFENLFGYKAEETEPTFELLISLIHPEDRERIADKVQQYLTNPKAINWFEEYRFKKSDGTYAYVIDRAVFLRDASGRTTRVVGAMTDITYRKEHEESLKGLNEQLEKHAKDLEISNAELEQFAYIASHDLQEPLRMVTSFLNQLERKYSDQLDDKAQQYIYFAVDGAKRMRQIILDLLEFSRVGRLEEDPMSFSLNNLINDYCVLRKSIIEEKSAVIKTENLPEVTCFKTPVTQIFHNLIDNAIKYSREGVPPEITIKATDRGKLLEFSVCDNGIGIDQEYFDKIFVIFQRLHDKSEYSGTGMGLAIVKKAIENLGGKIWLKSNPGNGCCFYFTLPKCI